MPVARPASESQLGKVAAPTAPPARQPPTPVSASPQPGSPATAESHRYAPDTMLLAGEPVSTGTRVVLFSEPGGYDAYRGVHYFNQRRDETRGGTALPVPLDAMGVSALVDRVVLHYDVSGSSARCFRTLQNDRGLSCHFLLDVDGTVYQTLDLRERAWHAGTSNSRSVGIEMANVGAYPVGAKNPFAKWYRTDPEGRTRLILPADADVWHPALASGPSRSGPVVGPIHGRQMKQYDFTDAQYAALIKLTAALCRSLPRVTPDAPRDASGRVRSGVMPAGERVRFAGLTGHYHLTPEKTDPGPAFDWERVVNGVKVELD